MTNENENELVGILFYNTTSEGGAINVIASQGAQGFPKHIAEDINASIYRRKYPNASEEEAKKITMTGDNSFESEVCTGVYVDLTVKQLGAVAHIIKGNRIIEFDSVGELFLLAIRMTDLHKLSINTDAGRAGIEVLHQIVTDAMNGDFYSTLGANEGPDDHTITLYYIDNIRATIRGDQFLASANQINSFDDVIHNNSSSNSVDDDKKKNTPTIIKLDTKLLN